MRDALAALAHDLREPVTTIRLYLDLVRMDAEPALPEEVRRHLATIREAAAEVERRLRALDDLRKVRVPPGPLPEVDVGEVVDEVLRVRADGTAPRARVSRGSLPRVQADRQALAVLVGRLLEHASRAPGAPAPLEVRADREGGAWVFTVRPATAEGAANKGRPAQDPAPRDADGGAWSIELTVCRRVVALHGGRFWTEPAAGGGLSYRFTLSPPTA